MTKRQRTCERAKALLEELEWFIDYQQATIGTHTLPGEFDDLKAYAITRLEVERFIQQLT